MFIAYISLDPFDAAILKVMVVPPRIFCIHFALKYKNKKQKRET